VAFAGEFSLLAGKAGNCTIAGPTVMFSGGDRAAMSVFGQGVGAAVERADDEG